MYETIIFDLDGTLLDTLDDLRAAVNAALSFYGLKERTREEVRSFVGNGIAKLMERSIGDKDFPHFADALQKFKEYYGEHCKDETKPYEGILSLLAQLKARGIQTAVVSNKADFAVKILAEEYFDGLLLDAVGENECMGIRKKPAPDSLFAVMKKLGAKKETTVYVGDSEVDIQTAKNAGVDCISVTWGFKDRGFLIDNGASRLVDSPNEIFHYCSLKIGNTPLVQIEKLGAGLQVFAKIEKENGGGSIKDRVALAIIENAVKSGKLQKGGTVVEATSGNTGIGLALVAKTLGYKAVIVMPDTMTAERREMIKAYGGEVVLTDGKLGMQGAVERAKMLVESTQNAILADQFNNPVCAQVHYEKTGVEIWEQMQGKVDIFVACVGTGGTLTGIGRYLKERNPNVKIVAVEPAKSPLLSQGKAASHGIQGIGANFVPSVLDRTIYDEIVTVTDEDAYETARALQREESLFVGISSGAAAAAAIAIAKRKENAGKRVVTVFPDDGNRYLSVL